MMYSNETDFWRGIIFMAVVFGALGLFIGWVWWS